MHFYAFMLYNTWNNIPKEINLFMHVNEQTSIYCLNEAYSLIYHLY